jgi:spermidine synthase
MIDRTENKLEAFALVTVLFSAALLAAVFAIRTLKVMLGVSIGEHVGLLPMFYSSLLALLPVSLLHGALFTFSCRIYAMQGEPSDAVAGRVYVDETVGTMAGGVICTFVFIPLLNSFEVVIAVAFLNMLVCLWILAPVWRAGRQRTMPLLCGLLAAITGIGLLTGQADHLQRSSIRMQWAGHNVVHYRNSPYGNIAVLENQGQYLFFLDGIPEIITPVPDMLFVEEFVHLPMLAHPYPQDILILRGGGHDRGNPEAPFRAKRDLCRARSRIPRGNPGVPDGADRIRAERPAGALAVPGRPAAAGLLAADL